MQRPPGIGRFLPRHLSCRFTGSAPEPGHLPLKRVAASAIAIAALATTSSALEPSRQPTQEPATAPHPSISAPLARPDRLTVGEERAYEAEAAGQVRLAANAWLDLVESCLAPPDDASTDVSRQAAIAETWIVQAGAATRRLGVPAASDLLSRHFDDSPAQVPTSERVFDRAHRIFRSTLDAPITARHSHLHGVLHQQLLAFAAAAGDMAAAAEHQTALGVLHDWWIIGPFDNERGTGFQTEAPPERGIDLQATVEGKIRPVRYRRLSDTASLDGVVRFATHLRPTQQISCFAATGLLTETAAEVCLWISTNGSYRVRLDGAICAERDVRRDLRSDQDAIVLRLSAGAHALLIEVGGEDSPPEFSARISAVDGSPTTAVRVMDAPPESAAADGSSSDEEAEPSAPAEAGSLKVAPGARAYFAGLDAAEAPADALRLAGLLESIQPDDIAHRRDRALATQAAASLAPPAAPARMLLARTLARDVRIAAEQEANRRRTLLTELVADVPGHVPAQRALAAMERTSIGASLTAERRMRSALVDQPDAPELWLELASALAGQGFDQRAMQALQSARAAEPNLVETQRRLAIQLTRDRSRQPRLGIAALREALTATGPWQQGLTYLAWTALRDGDAAGGRAWLEESMRLWPHDSDSATYAGDLAVSTRRLDDARAIVAHRLSLCPEDTDALALSARVAVLAGDTNDATRILAAILDLDPGNERARRHHEFLAEDREPFHTQLEIPTDELIAKARERGDTPTVREPLYVHLQHNAVRAFRNGTTSHFRHFVVEVLNTAGARQLRNYYVRHAPDEQRARVLEVTVVNVAGEVRSPTARGSHVSLPDLVPGDIVEFKTRVDDLAPSFFGDYFGLEHSFSGFGGYPVGLSKLDLLLDDGRDYHFQTRGGAPDATRQLWPEDETVQWLTWTLRDLPAFEVAVRRPSPQEAAPLVRVSTYGTWDEFTTWWWNLIRKQMEVSPEMRTKVQELTADLQTDEDKVRAIYEFVTTEVRYKAWEFGVHGYKPYSAQAVFARRHGDCKDKALLMTTMLREVGIESFPVLIQADDPRSQDDLTLPLVQHFNHCISYIPGMSAPNGTRGGTEAGRFLDGTALFHPVSTLPRMDQGADVLIVQEREAKIATTPTTESAANSMERISNIVLDARGAARVGFTQRVTNTAAVGIREWLGSEPKRRREVFERWFTQQVGTTTLQEFNVSDLDDLSAPVEVGATLKVPQLATRSNDTLTLKTGLFDVDLLELAAATERKLALLLGSPRSTTETMQLTAPTGFEFAHVPKDVALSESFGTFSRTSIPGEDGVLSITTTFQLDATRIEPDAYPAWRQFASEVARAASEEVVIRRQR